MGLRPTKSNENASGRARRINDLGRIFNGATPQSAKHPFLIHEPVTSSNLPHPPTESTTYRPTTPIRPTGEVTLMVTHATYSITSNRKHEIEMPNRTRHRNKTRPHPKPIIPRTTHHYATCFGFSIFGRNAVNSPIAGRNAQTW